jgi:hypothetical protein
MSGFEMDPFFPVKDEEIGKLVFYLDSHGKLELVLGLDF